MTRGAVRCAAPFGIISLMFTDRATPQLPADTRRLYIMNLRWILSGIVRHGHRLPSALLLRYIFNPANALFLTRALRQAFGSPDVLRQKVFTDVVFLALPRGPGPEYVNVCTFWSRVISPTVILCGCFCFWDTFAVKTASCIFIRQKKFLIWSL